MAKAKEEPKRPEVATVTPPESLPPVSDVPPVVPPPPPPLPVAKKPTHQRARVSVPDTHFGSCLVTIPADAANPTQAAIEAAKQLRGIVSFGAGPQVEFLD